MGIFSLPVTKIFFGLEDGRLRRREVGLSDRELRNCSTVIEDFHRDAIEETTQ